MTERKSKLIESSNSITLDEGGFSPQLSHDSLETKIYNFENAPFQIILYVSPLSYEKQDCVLFLKKSRYLTFLNLVLS